MKDEENFKKSQKMLDEMLPMSSGHCRFAVKGDAWH